MWLSGCTPHSPPSKQAILLTPTVPAHLDINGQTWDLVPVDHIDNNGSEGETYCDTREIYYVITDPVDLRDTLWHEVFHAGDCIHGGKDTWWNSSQTDEAGIKNLADFMNNFTRDNKQFVSWVEDDN